MHTGEGARAKVVGAISYFVDPSGISDCKEREKRVCGGGGEIERTGIVSFPVPVGVGGDILLFLLLMMLLLVAAGEHLLEELELRAGERGEEGEEEKKQCEGEHFCCRE